MINYDSQKYKTSKALIDANKDKEGGWDSLLNLSFLGDFDEIQKKSILANMASGITYDEWIEIVNDEKNEYENCYTATIDLGNTMIPSHNDFDYKLDKSSGSAWMAYNRTLAKNGFSDETRRTIELSSHRILNKLSLDTRDSEPIKGLVIGNVQSGKTANMAALMAMAADQGWNLFIILSGTIENLRKQTQERFYKDLVSNTSTKAWESIDNVENTPNWQFSLERLNLDSKSNKRYLMVCLKNSTRLKNLLNWLKRDEKNRENLKILFIDDEADQAGINSKKESKDSSGTMENERTKINQLIVNLLTNKDGEGREVNTKFKALNYVAYTATPYANILNEKPGPCSIYPSSFVSCLSVSNTYFGPQRIFGLEGYDGIEGMDIVNSIENDDLPQLIKIYNGDDCKIPNSLKDSILWFYVCFAIRKYQKINKPVSMLIHTSFRQTHHSLLANAIKKWINGLNEIDFIKECQRVYEKETLQFSKNKFYSQYREYNNKNINDYPKFRDISNELLLIYQKGINTIKIADDGEVGFSNGVHLCIDNCANNYVENSNEHIRLIYPKKELDYTTGFIIIGGTTLSRGLTIEGLVSTYFLRVVKQADTLMQMGRWFGYRPGYELLPRIWMTDNTRQQFDFLSILDFELRKEMEYMEETGISPKLVGIKVRYFPRRNFLEISSKNKMKAAKQVQMSFGGVSTQSTIFYSDNSILESNYNNTSIFINGIGKPVSLSKHVKAENSIIWENVSNDKVIDYLSKMKFPKNDTSFLDIKLFKKWYEDKSEEYGLVNWNVVFAGIGNREQDKFSQMGEYTICTVNRSKKINKYNDDYIRIGALRAPKDLYVDIDIESNNLSESDKENIRQSKLNKEEYKIIRSKAGLDKTSLLIIYSIDKNSIPRNGETNRINMNTLTDVIGLAIYIPPNQNKLDGSYVSIDLSGQDTVLDEVDIDVED